jgi:hypothetical protein
MKIRLIVPVNYQAEAGGPTVQACPTQTYGPAIADIAGGFTATQATGGWKDAVCGLVIEPVTVFDCSVEPVHGSHYVRLAAFFRLLAKRIARELNQDCVYLEIDGQVELVEP